MSNQPMHHRLPRRPDTRRHARLVAAAALVACLLAPSSATALAATSAEEDSTPVPTPTPTSPVLADAEPWLPLMAAVPWMPPQRYNGEVSGVVGTWGGYANGMIPLDVLCSPSWNSRHQARCDAAEALEAMNRAYRAAFGVNMSITSSYRTYEEQVRLKAEKPTLAAKPGTSNHGWGLAIDFGGGINTFGSAQHNWMRANANTFGWFHPRWAQYDGSLPEPWHWEYAGAVASGNLDQNRLLALQLTRTQPWDGPQQRQCLSDLWSLQSGWDHRAVGASSSVRGIPQIDLARLFGSTWATSTAAKAYLSIPQRQVEHGLRELTAQFSDACRAWEYWGPSVSFDLPAQTTVPAGGTVPLTVRYDKLRAPVPAASLTVQRWTGQGWTDQGETTITDGVGTLVLAPGGTTTEYRVRNWNGSAVSPSLKIHVAELGATVTGPSTVAAGGRTTVSVAYSKDSKPVSSAVVTLQREVGGAWIDVEDVPVVDGVAVHDVRPGAVSGTFRFRNWNTSAVTGTFAVDVAELTAVVGGSTEIPANSTAEVSVRYTKDSLPVASATVQLQVLRDGSWVDASPVPVLAGSATVRLNPGITTTTYRFLNWNGSAATAPITLTVLAPVFTDVGPDHPFKPAIDWLVLSGTADGYDDDSFRPSTPVARQAMAAFLYRMAGSPAHVEPATSPFSDLTPTSPFYAEITWLAGQGVTTGTAMPDGTVEFRPAEPVSRGAMAAFLHRFSGSPAVDVRTASFADVGPSSPFAREIAWIGSTGISTGTALPDGTSQYRATEPVSRQAMAAFLHRLASLRG